MRRAASRKSEQKKVTSAKVEAVFLVCSVLSLMKFLSKFSSSFSSSLQSSLISILLLFRFQLETPPTSNEVQTKKERKKEKTESQQDMSISSQRT